MESDDTTATPTLILDQPDSKPKAMHKDPVVFLLLPVAIAAYEKTGDMRLVILVVAMYVLPNFVMRIISQIKDSA